MSAREGLMNEILHAETMENINEKFLKLKYAFKSKRIKFNLGKTKVMMTRSSGEILKTKIDRSLWYFWKESYCKLVVHSL